MDGQVTKAYSYIRFSSPEQAKGNSLRRQTALAAAYAERHGMELDEALSYEDPGVSAFRGMNSEIGRLGDFLTAVRNGLVPKGSVLLVESLDRISRQTVGSALRLLQDIVTSGVDVVTLSDGKRYTAENLDQDVLSIIMALLTFARAHEESAIKGARVSAAWSAKRDRAASEPLTMRCPAWLRLRDDRSGFDLIPERAAVVRRIFELAASGVGQHTIAATLNAEKVPTWGDSGRAPGAHWHRSYVSKILKSPAVVGVFVPHVSAYEDGQYRRVAQDPVEGYFPAVVDAETARRAGLLTGGGANPKRGRHAASAVRHVLAGLAKCPLCEGTMTRVTKGSGARAGKPYLVCSAAKAGAGCEYRTVRQELVEGALRSRADELVLKSPEEPDDLELEDLRSELTEVDARLGNLVEAVATGNSIPALVEKLAHEQRRREQLEADIRSLSVARETNRQPLVKERMADLRAALKAEPFDVAAANTALRQCAEAVVVDYRTGLLATRWRHGGETDLVFMWADADET